MAKIKYTGNAAWTRVVVDDKGTFSHFSNVLPGETVEVEDKVAKGLVKDHLPEAQRNFELVEEPKEAPAPARPATQARPADKR